MQKTETIISIQQLAHSICTNKANADVMGIEEFAKLDERQQLDLLHEKAVYIGKREMDSRIAILFQLDSFYVEIIYRQYRVAVEEIKTSSSTDFISLYLDHIKLKF